MLYEFMSCLMQYLNKTRWFRGNYK